MKLIELKCKNCGANINADSECTEITCQYCQTTFKIDDEVRHIKLENMEQNGYDFEKGRLRAQKEIETNINYNIKQNSKKKKTLWLILAWIFLLPFTVTYFVATSNKLDKKKKIIIIIAMWIGFFIIVATSSAEESQVKKTKIIQCYSQEVYEKLDNLIGIDNIAGYFDNSYACDELNLKNQHNKKIEIEMNKNELISISLDKKYIYHTDKTIDIYDPITLRKK